RNDQTDSRTDALVSGDRNYGGFDLMTDPEIYDPLEEIRQQHEAFLNDLEGLAVEALASGDWSEVYAHIATIAGSKTNLSECFNSPEEYDEAIAFINRLLGDEASTKSLTRSGADLLPTDQQIDSGVTQ
ncbi:MAG TPA: hypothetical protein V6D48_14385, partial [Oculatellaceae cyanobacterium]